MKLSCKDKEEISQIIKGFCEDVKDQISKEVDRDIRQMKSNPITNLMGERFNNDMAFNLASESDKWQELAHESLWDFLVKHYEFEYALAIYLKRHETQEAA